MRWMTRAFSTAQAALRAAPAALWRGRQSLLHLALPGICAGCEQDLHEPSTVPLCLVCRKQFSMSSESVCPRCAAPLPLPVMNSDGCAHCRDMTFCFQRATALGVYQDELRSLVLRMKHVSGEPLSLAAGELLGTHIRAQGWNEPVDLVTAAPMHWSRRIWRAMNAPAVIAESTSRELNAPLQLDLLRAVRMVPRQSTLTASQRRRNMRGAFATSRSFDIRDAHVLVIDDVMTTGATANALARPLIKAGAKQVSIAVVARSVLVP